MWDFRWNLAKSVVQCNCSRAYWMFIHLQRYWGYHIKSITKYLVLRSLSVSKVMANSNLRHLYWKSQPILNSLTFMFAKILPITIKRRNLVTRNIMSKWIIMCNLKAARGRPYSYLRGNYRLFNFGKNMKTRLFRVTSEHPQNQPWGSYLYIQSYTSHPNVWFTFQNAIFSIENYFLSG